MLDPMVTATKARPLSPGFNPWISSNIMGYAYGEINRNIGDYLKKQILHTVAETEIQTDEKDNYVSEEQLKRSTQSNLEKLQDSTVLSFNGSVNKCVPRLSANLFRLVAKKNWSISFRNGKE